MMLTFYWKKDLFIILSHSNQFVHCNPVFLCIFVFSCYLFVLILVLRAASLSVVGIILYYPRKIKTLQLEIIEDQGVRSMISFAGALSFAKLMMMSSAPTKKSAGAARYAYQDPLIRSFRQLPLCHSISTPICIRGAFFLRRTRIHFSLNAFLFLRFMPEKNHEQLLLCVPVYLQGQKVQ